MEKTQWKPFQAQEMEKGAVKQQDDSKVHRSMNISRVGQHVN